jgi:CHAT domain-containing protein/Tfp pilus assembly protein PilF
MIVRAPIFRLLLSLVATMAFVGDRPVKPFDLYGRLLLEADRAMRNGNFEKAAEAYHNAERVARESGNHGQVAYCGTKSGLLAWNLGKIVESRRMFQAVLEMVRGHESLRSERIYCETALSISEKYHLAKSLRDSNHFEKSIESFEEAINLARTIKSPEFEVKCLRQMSVCYWEKNDLQKYFELNRSARDLANALAHRREEGICLNNMGTFFWKINDYSNALDCFDRAIRILQLDGNKENISGCLNNLGILYMTFSEYEKAINYLIKASLVDEKLDNNANMCMDFNNLGILFRKKGVSSNNKIDFFMALSYLNRALKLSLEQRNDKMQMKVMNNIGELNVSLNKIGAAKDHFQKAYVLAISLHDMEDSFSILNNLGFCFIAEKNLVEAQNCFLSTINNEQTIFDSEIVGEAFYGLGQCYEQLGQDGLALNCYKKRVAITDRIRSRIFIDSFKSGFAKRSVVVYSSLLNLLAKMRERNSSSEIDEEIFLNIERAKARAFLESLGESRVDIKKRLGSELKDEESQISGRISRITASLNGLAVSTSGRAELLAELAREEEAYLRLISKMRSSNPALAGLVLPDVGSSVEIRDRLLDRDTMMIEFFLAEPKSLAVVMETDRMEIFLLPSKGELQNSVKGYIKFLAKQAIPAEEGRLAAQRIYRQLLSPLMGRRVLAKKKLIVIPDGILYLLPFETLIDENWKDGRRYLVERYEISYMPSATSLRVLMEPRAPALSAEGLLAFGDPLYRRSAREAGNGDGGFGSLPYSREEVRTISKYFSRQHRKLFLGRDAREDVLKNMDGHEFSIIHLACHSVVDEIHPFRSALILSPPEDGVDDGFLQVRELYNLRLSAELVVLSACRTALGQMESWEGVMGLPRIFFYTGARSVLSTLWPIEDRSTALFMDLFYGGLARGLSKAKALQRAKIDMIHFHLADPHFWAPFVLNGDPRSTIAFQN